MALGVSFGLACSLGLKHSHLASYPHIESCLVALCAYTSYFFSNGISMSGTSRFARLILELIVRYRVTPILRYHLEALRLSYHVETHPENDQVHVRRLGAVI